MRSESQGPELVIGLVGATGTDLDFVSRQIQSSLASLGYESKVIRVVHLLRSFEEWAHLQSVPEDTRILAHMDAGDAFRSRTRYADGLARLAILAIEEHRQTLTGSLSVPATRVGFILRSLKRREEVETLRSVYGDRFILVGAYSPRSARVTRLATRIAESHSATISDGFRSIAETLVNRDLDDEGKDSGQRVSEVFPLSDFFVNANDMAGVSAAITRVASLVFGYQYSTPTRDECGMFFAQAAALRSGSLARQVGAAICSADGDVVTVGTNEVPKAGGGSYWEGDANDQRDHVWGADASDRKKRIIATQVLERLKAAGWLSHPYDTTSSQELADMALGNTGQAVLRDTQLMRVVEYVRAVHAEMSAIADAARRGASIRGCTLYATTFPCHHCARHIVAAGIARVVYVEPYPKSLALELHWDAIEMEPGTGVSDKVRFEPFVGVAPRQYSRVFSMTRRKDREGQLLPWNKQTALPRYNTVPSSYLQAEVICLKELGDRLLEIGLSSKKEEPSD